MAATPPSQPSPDASGIHIGDVGGSVNFSALGDIVGGDKITTITTTIQISVEAVTQRPLVNASPYRGLDRFEDRDKDLFFGRDQLIKSLLAQLSASNVLLVLGASGCGKSSVVRAGLLPQLAQLIGARFRYFTFVPDVNPFESLRSALQGAGFSQAQTRDLADARPETAIKLAHALQREGDQWLFFIDQFEELFTVGDETLRAGFIAALVAIAQDPSNSTKLVLAMRADFLDRFSPFPQFAKIIEKNIDFVADMHADELRQAIEQPAARHGVVFERGLVEEIIKDVQGQAGSLPLLQYTLDLLWQEEARGNGLTDRHLNTRAYRELGGVRGALQKRADEIYASFGDGTDAKTAAPKQAVARQIFLRLVDLAGEGSNDAAWRPVRRRASMAMFASAQDQEILQALINQKLLVSNREGDDATVEVAHEALFTSWGRLKNWIEAGKQVIFARNRLADDARRWERRQEEGDAGADEELISGTRLSQALDLRARGDFATVVGGLGEKETKFLDASLVQRDRRAQSELEAAQRLAAARKLATSRLQAGLAVAVVLLLAAVGAVLFARSSAQKSRQTFSEADFIQASEMIEQGRVNEALAYLARALRTWPDNRAAADRVFALLTERGFLLPASGPVNLGRGITSIRCAEGKWLAVQRDMGYASIVDPSQTVLAARGNVARARASTKSQNLPTLMAELSSDGKLLATATGVPLLRSSDIWPSTRGEGPTDRQWTAANDSLVSSRDSQKGYAQVWDGATGQPITPPLEHGKAVFDVRFSPDNKRIVTASEDRTARIWDAKTGAPLTPPLPHNATVVSATFSPDGKQIQTVSDRVMIWDSTTGTKIAESAFPAIAAIYSPDGRFIAAASEGANDGGASLQLLDTMTGKEIGKPIPSGPAITSIQFDPDGNRVRHSFAGRFRNKDDSGGIIEARTEDGQADKPRETGGIGVNEGLLAPDGRTLLVALGDRTLRIWDNEQVGETKPLAPPVTFPGPPIHLAFDPTGAEFVVLYKDPEWESGTDFVWFQRWNRHTSAVRSELRPAEKGPAGAAAEKNNVGDLIADKSHDGKRRLVVTQSGTAYLDFTNGGKSAQPLPQEGEYGGMFGMQTAKFSSDGRLIATGEGGDFRIATGFARIWDGVTGAPRSRPMRHSLAVTFAAFTPDSERLVTIDSKLINPQGVHIRIWDVRTGLPITDPIKSEVGSERIQISADRARLTGFSEEEGAEVVDIGLPAGSKIPDWFPLLAEIAGGLRLNAATGVIESLGERFEELERIRALLAKANDDPVNAFGKWFLANPGTRTISPYSKVTVPDYVGACLQLGDEKSLDRAQSIAAGNKELLAKIAAQRAKGQSAP